MVKNTDLSIFNTQFEIGEEVKHRYYGDRLIVIGFNNNQNQLVECRTEDLRAQYFYRHELEKINGENTPAVSFNDPIKGDDKFTPVQGIE